MKKIYKGLLAGVGMMAVMASCTDDLDQTPQYGINASTVYSSIDGYKAVMAKIYGSYSLVGQERSGSADLSSNQGQDLLRNLFNLQEAPTDEAAMTWASGDELTYISTITWDANDIWVADTYYRLMYNIALINEFLRYCGDGAIGGFSDSEQTEIRHYAAEARFMRALDYYYMLDLFRKAPKVDENTPTAGVVPEAFDGPALYDYIASELAEIEPLLPETNSYGRANRATAQALAVRLSLNGEVYTGQKHYDDCITWAKKIISNPAYSLEPTFSKLFNADNNLRTNEIIFAFAADALHGITYGSATNIICGAAMNDYNADDPTCQDPARVGIDGGWGSFRVRGEYSALFTSTADSRNTFWREGQDQYFTDDFTTRKQGYWSEKWTNLTDAGVPASSSDANGCATDYPMFRLAEIYLSAAEAVLRGGAGMSQTEALDLVNKVRQRAYGDNSGNITAQAFNLDFIIDERGREFCHEMMRRTDLVRFDRFTTDKYIWQWKGNTLAGKAVDDRYNIYPIPAAEVSANPNLTNELY